MKAEFENLLELFTKSLSSWEYNQYIRKIRCFFEYLLENKSNVLSAERLFKEELTPQDIISSCKYYILKNPDVSSVSAVDDYLIAFNQFFELVLIPNYPNQNLIARKPFNYLGELIINEVRQFKELKDVEKFLPIRDKHYNFILAYINFYIDSDLKTRQILIIIKLLLLYGFSFTRISELKISNINTQTNTLTVPLDGFNQVVRLELPYSLANELKIHIDKNQKQNDDYLFFNDDLSQIKPYFTQYFIKKMRKAYEEKEKNALDDKRFTNTGLAMYAIVQMLQTMDQSSIMALTDMGFDIIQTCQSEFNTNQRINLNRYINHSIRGIATYDDFQKNRY